MDEDDTLLGYEGDASNHMMLGDENGTISKLEILLC
jgi:hypothetical protein